MALTEKYISSAAAGGGDGSSGSPYTWAEMITEINAGGAAGNRYNVKADGTYSRTTTTDAITGSGSATSPIIIRGYNTTITDGFQGRLNGNGALLTTNMPVITYTTGRLNITGTFIIVETINITWAASARTVDLGADSVIWASSVTNSGTNAASAGVTLANRGIALNCDLQLTGASGGAAAITAAATSVAVDSCRIRVTSSTAPGIVCNSASIVVFNVIFGSGGIGISMTSTTGSPYIRSNTVVGCGGDGIAIVTGTTVMQKIIGNLITDNTGDGIEMTQTSIAGLIAYNRTRSNASAISNGGDWITATSYNQVTTAGAASTDYVNSAANDYTLVATSPATSSGIPPYASIGALQRTQTGSTETVTSING